MALLKLAPTKSQLLGLRRRLAFAEEGYDLLEQKRQILIFELMRRLDRARALESDIGRALRRAFAALRRAELEIGSAALDRAALGVRMDHQASLSERRLMGLRIPRVEARIEPVQARFGFAGTSAGSDPAMLRFVEVLPLAAELAELQNFVLRLARELARTQRRCNALSKTVIPDCRETIRFIASVLEERERESFVILRMVRDRLRSGEAA